MAPSAAKNLPDVAERAGAPKGEVLTIKPANIKVVAVTIVGTTAYVQHKFSAKAQAQIVATQEAGQQAKKGKKREAKDFAAVYESAIHYSREGWIGIPASAFRAACIDVCRATGFQMTRAKMSIFCKADSIDRDDGTPLVKITKGTPERHMGHARNDNGSVDVRARPLWQAGWEAVVRLEYDADQFTANDVVNLLDRAGRQVGIGEGRAFSKNSAGCGWGAFQVKAG
jgi:hypothetical protein